MLAQIYVYSYNFLIEYIAIMKMAPYEAFACHCGKGDVVLRESYQANTRGKLYYACPRSKVNNHLFFGVFYINRFIL